MSHKAIHCYHPRATTECLQWCHPLISLATVASHTDVDCHNTGWCDWLQHLDPMCAGCSTSLSYQILAMTKNLRSHPSGVMANTLHSTSPSFASPLAAEQEITTDDVPSDNAALAILLGSWICSCNTLYTAGLDGLQSPGDTWLCIYIRLQGVRCLPGSSGHTACNLSVSITTWMNHDQLLPHLCHMPLI